MNISSLDYGTKSNAENFFNTSISNYYKTNKSNKTQFNRNTSHTKKNTILSTNVSSSIWQVDISDHFLILSYFNEEIISSRKDTYSKRNLNVTYNRLIKMFSKASDTSFPEIQKWIKTKSFLSPWITKDIQISKRKQKLYERILKKWTYTSEKI